MMNFYIQIPKRKGHYKDYSKFITNLFSEEKVFEIMSFKEKVKLIFSNTANRSIYLDLEHNDILWILLRSFFSSCNYSVVTSFTSFLNKNINWRYFYKKKEIAKLRNILKYKLLNRLVRSKKLFVISIHKGTEFENKIQDISSLITYDIQYYDLKYLDIELKLPIELMSFPFAKKKPLILMFNHTSGEKRNLDEFSTFIKKTNKYNFLIVGNSSFLEGYSSNNICLVNRYVSNEELIFMMNYADIIYAYYNNNRPSGFMGRAIQLDKYVIVHKEGYLGKLKYNKSIAIEGLDELERHDLTSTKTNDIIQKSNLYDESQKIKDALIAKCN